MHKSVDSVTHKWVGVTELSWREKLLVSPASLLTMASEINVLSISHEVIDHEDDWVIASLRLNRTFGKFQACYPLHSLID